MTFAQLPGRGLVPRVGGTTRRGTRLRPTVALALLVLAQGCSCDAPLEPGDLLGDGFASVVAVDGTHVKLTLSRGIDKGTAKPAAFAIANYTVVPAATASIADVSADSDTVVTLTTSELTTGAQYTLEVKGLKDAQGRALDGTINFTPGGAGPVVPVQIVIDDVETARLHQSLTAMVTVDDSGVFSERLQAYPFVDNGAAFVAQVNVAVDAARTLDPGDDTDPGVDRRPYAVLVVDEAGRMASTLVRFVLPNESADRTVPVTVLPPIEIQQPQTDVLPDPPDDANPGDGVRQVRIVVDNRASHELVQPQLKVAFGPSGDFDASFPQTLDLTEMDGDNAGYWQVVVGVKVDPNRTVDGSTNDTFPYFAFLVDQGVEHEALSVAVTAPDETPATVRLSLGNPNYVPVTFRVDTSQAYVTADGSVRDHYPGESIFLTGEWQQAADALGNNCGDSFTGGENACLEMKELAGHPGVWTRTLWLPGGRPYGWKVVRCTAGTGCGDLNNLVSSSGRAFATVMKNLATENIDAFADPNVQIIDPLNPGAYAGGVVYQGQGVGVEPNPAGIPDNHTMFKQEVPDLVVVVDNVPIKTRVILVGAWRDINLPSTPQDIVSQHLSVDLTPADYDDGFIGRFPPSREEP